jgi:mono/diheme cytochrome c family protein
VFALGGLGIAALVGLVLTSAAPASKDALLLVWGGCRHGCAAPLSGDCGAPQVVGDPAGSWYWLRSPDEEKRAVAGLYNRYCIRCHGVDGRGVWDIPDVPNFTDVRWQVSRSDAEIVLITLEGRGAVMPPFRGTLTLEEAWAMARYLRTFVPESEKSRPELGPQGPAPGPQPPSQATLPPAPAR